MTTLNHAFQDLLAILDRIEMPFLVGGSVASGTYGLSGQTNGIDVVIDLPLDRVKDFCEAFGPEWYADPLMVTKAIRAGRAFNLIHIGSAYKFDFFSVGDDSFGRTQIARRRYTTSTVPGLENIEFPIASAEDTVLAKLVWFRKGGEVSDSQWHDILGVIQVQAGQLDHAYLEEWAEKLGVADLLRKALTAKR